MNLFQDCFSNRSAHECSSLERKIVLGLPSLYLSQTGSNFRISNPVSFKADYRLLFLSVLVYLKWTKLTYTKGKGLTSREIPWMTLLSQRSHWPILFWERLTSWSIFFRSKVDLSKDFFLIFFLFYFIFKPETLY